MKRLLASLCMILTAPSFASATVNLLDKDDWKVQMSGFVEMDNFRDSKRAFTEVVGNGAVPRAGTFNGDNPRYQSSIRNSRLAFSVLPPQQGEWKSKGYLEFDLLGYDPGPPSSSTSTAPSQSESGFYTNATLRVRHAYMSAENDGWKILAGQYWTLFGWNPVYVLTTASVPPGPGTIYQRTPQVTGMKTLEFGSNKLDIAASATRPSQRDSGTPNLEAGLHWSNNSWTSGFASASGDVSAMPLSVALTGTMRSFDYSKTGTAADGTSRTNGSAFAVDAMIPVLPSSDGKDVSNTITITGEYSNGKGNADAFPSWTAGMPQYPSGAGGQNATNLDAGQGGFDSGGSLQLLKLQSWNAEVQYHLPSNMGFFTIGHAELGAKGYDGFTAATAVTYDKAKMDFINFFHDFTPQLRIGAEYAKFTTHYVAQVNGKSDESDDRYALNGYFRF